MSIECNYPDFQKFINNEWKTLKIIGNLSSIKKTYPELANDAFIYSSMYHNKNSDKFKFSSQVEIELPKRKKTDTLFLLEISVTKDFDESTYQLSICDNSKDKPEILRKFHFDYDPKIYSNSKKRSKFHLQYGGENTPKINELKIDTSGLHSWLSEPRISFPPMNLAIFLDLVFCEFWNEDNNKIVETKNWRQLIKSNEKLILHPYYDSINWCISNGSSHASYLIRDLMYGS